MIESEESVKPEELAEALETLSHQHAFKVYQRWLDEVIEQQVLLVAQGGTDTHRQYLETGVLQGIMRIRDIAKDVQVVQE